MNEYIIEIYRRGRTHQFRYKTLAAAIKTREQIFQATGIVVGISAKVLPPPADSLVDGETN